MITRGSLPNLIRVDRAVCPLHGPIFPEGFSLPFSVDTPLLDLLPMVCGVCLDLGGPEECAIVGLDFRWQEIDRPLTQHWGDVGHDPDAYPPFYPIWHVRPVAEGEDSVTYRTGSKRHPDDPD